MKIKQRSFKGKDIWFEEPYLFATGRGLQKREGRVARMPYLRPSAGLPPGRTVAVVALLGGRRTGCRRTVGGIRYDVAGEPSARHRSRPCPSSARSGTLEKTNRVA